jgi:hypothetical protein
MTLATGATVTPLSPEAVYTHGHSALVTRIHARRSAAKEAAFFLPHLQPGMRELPRAAGFGRVATSTSFRWDGSTADSRSFGDLLAQRLALPNFAQPICAQGWADAATLQETAAACAAWSRHPDPFAAMVMAEAVGRIE